MKFKLASVAIVAALGLSGCAGLNTLETLSGVSVTPQQVYIAQNAFVAFEATVKNYDLLPRCPVTVGPCNTLAGVKAVDAAVRSARKAVTEVSAYVTANPGSVVPVSLYNVAIAAVAAAQDAFTKYNVK